MILHRLRAETAESHARLEQRLDLLRPELTLADYTGLLLRFRSLYQAWEPLAERELMPTPWASLVEPHRNKLPLLNADLRALQADSEVAAPDLSWFAGSLARIMGGLYVLEGSTLGSQILSRHFSARFSLAPESGLAYFYGYGALTGLRWREFSETLSRFASLTVSEDEIVPGARRMFEAAESCLLGGPGTENG